MGELIRPDGTLIHYEISGHGHPMLVLQASIDDATRQKLAQTYSDYSLIFMDQRHTGQSRTALAAFRYEDALGDQLAVLDQEGIEQTALLGAGLGCCYALRLAYEAPVRVGAAVLREPIGVDSSNTMDTYFSLFRETIRIARAEGLEGVVAAAIENPDFLANPAGGPWAQRLHDEPAFRNTLVSLGRENYIALIVDFCDGIFPWKQTLFSVNNTALSRISTPILVAAGNDDVHPQSVAKLIADNVPDSIYVEQVGAGLDTIVHQFLTNAL